MRYFVAVVAVLVLLARADEVRSESCHGMPTGVEEGTVSGGIVTEAAGYNRGGGDAGSYQGVSARLVVSRGFFTARALFPVYRLDRTGATGSTVVGSGDPFLGADVRLLRTTDGAIQGGLTAAAMLPLGSRTDGLGMGHVMLMPGVWTVLSGPRLSLRGELAYGHALSTGHQHGASADTPIVNPMNAREVLGAAFGDIRLLPSVVLLAALNGATPVGSGSARGVASAGVRLPLGVVEPWTAIQVPFVGDPFTLRVIVALSIRV